VGVGQETRGGGGGSARVAGEINIRVFPNFTFGSHRRLGDKQLLVPGLRYLHPRKMGIDGGD
jgi:hypothetical protein